MSSNKSLIEKADIALSDLATAGELNPEQANLFIRVMIESNPLLNAIRVVAMTAPQRNIDKIGFGSRILRKATSATALADNQRSKPDLSQVVLNTKEVIAEVHIPYDVLEDNIEGGNPFVPLQSGAGGLHDTIVSMMAQRASLDLEEQAILGDSGSSDDYIAMNEGFLKLATVNVVNAGGAGFSKDVVKQAVKVMPPKYLQNRAGLVHFVSVNNETELRDQYATRQTSLGDTNLQEAAALRIFGSRIIGVPNMPEETGLYTDPRNLIFGIQRRVSLEYDKDIRARKFIIVLTARIDWQIEETNALVKYSNVGS